MESESIHHLRRDYENQPLLEEGLNADPIKQFRQWFHDAQRSGIPEPNAMTLATADTSGRVSSRTVLLKAYDVRGFIFFTHYGSRKARQIAENPRVSLLFPWIPLARQIEIEGHVEKISTAESLAYFMSRPFGSRVGAWVSEQSALIKSRQVLLEKFELLKQKFANGEIQKPDQWGGYRIIPDYFEFWQGSANRLHDRFQYTRAYTDVTRDDVLWKINRLAP